MEDQIRFYQADLAGLSLDKQPCEACGMHLREHKWADLDPNGIVFNCSIKELLK